MKNLHIIFEWSIFYIGQNSVISPFWKNSNFWISGPSGKIFWTLFVSNESKMNIWSKIEFPGKYRAINMYPNVHVNLSVKILCFLTISQNGNHISSRKLVQFPGSSEFNHVIISWYFSSLKILQAYILLAHLCLQDS